MKIHSRSIFYAILSIAIVFLATVATLQVQAQRMEEITIVAPYEPTINEATKILIQPMIDAVSVPLPSFQIKITPRRYQLPNTIEPLPPLAPTADKPTQLQRNLLKAGFGNYLTPSIQFTANSLRNPGYAVGVDMKHTSSAGTIDKFGYSGYSHNAIKGFGQKHFDKFSISSDIYYDRRVVYPYGFLAEKFPSPTYDFGRETIRQRFNRFGTSVSAQHRNVSGEGLHYMADLDFGHIYDRYKTRENTLRFGAMLSKAINLFDRLDSQQLDLGLTYFGSRLNDSIKEYINTLVSIEPVLNFKYQEYGLRAGFRLQYDENNKSSIYFFPVAELNLRLIKKKLSVQAGIDGNVSKTTFESLAAENPFVQSVLQFKNPTSRFRFYVGIKGNISEVVDFGLDYSWAAVKDMTFFIGDTAAPYSRFKISYDNVNQMRVGSYIAYKMSDILSLKLAGNYNRYNPANETYAWYKPAFDLRISVSWNPVNKLTLDASVIANGKSNAKFWDGIKYSETEISPWMDVSATAKYQFSKQLHFFIDARNLTAQRQYFWYNYPSQRINVIAGAGFSF